MRKFGWPVVGKDARWFERMRLAVQHTDSQRIFELMSDAESGWASARALEADRAPTSHVPWQAFLAQKWTEEKPADQ